MVVEAAHWRVAPIVVSPNMAADRQQHSTRHLAEQGVLP